MRQAQFVFYAEVSWPVEIEREQSGQKKINGEKFSILVRRLTRVQSLSILHHKFWSV